MKRNLWALGSLIVAGSIGLSACSGGGGTQTLPRDEENVATTPEVIPAGFEDYYEQSVEFYPCNEDQVSMEMVGKPRDLENYECAILKAPMDWSDPQSETIELAVARYGPAGPNLFFNLGGPGANALESLSVFVESMLPEAVLDAYQIVAVDPRGVGASTPVRCWDDATLDEMLAGIGDEEWAPGEEATPEEIIAAYREESAEMAAKCLEESGEIVKFVDTDSVTRDFDMIRAALQQEKFNYLGYSYGTALGATYVENFPDRVGRMVLDGVLDPATTASELTALQAAGMQEALDRWIEDCLPTSGCPLTGDLESAQEQLNEFFAELEVAPLKAGSGDRKLTEALARTGVIASLYSESTYSLLTQSLMLAMEAKDGSALLFLADYYNGRAADGTYDGQQDAFTAINSLDMLPVGTPAEWEAEAERLKQDYPVLGSQFGYSSAALEGWPFEAANPRTAVTGEGAPKILLVGTLHDPATPYSMAESLAESLQNAVLLTYDGWGHGAYTTDGSDCVIKTVDTYLLSGKLPAEGTTCK